MQMISRAAQAKLARALAILFPTPTLDLPVPNKGCRDRFRVLQQRMYSQELARKKLFTNGLLTNGNTGSVLTYRSCSLKPALCSRMSVPISPAMPYTVHFHHEAFCSHAGVQRTRNSARGSGTSPGSASR